MKEEEQMAELKTTHEEEMVRLNRIAGQIRGVQKMIEDERYCIDILTQVSSIQGAIKAVGENILERHLKGCVKQSFSIGDQEDRKKKIDEVIEVLKKFK